jgi:hypothetical protein
MKQPFDLDALNQEIALERERLKDIRWSADEYRVLCKLLTRLRYHTNDDAKKLTKLRSKTYNKNKLELERSIVIQP